jgi:hypothetical protein
MSGSHAMDMDALDIHTAVVDGVKERVMHAPPNARKAPPGLPRYPNVIFLKPILNKKS